MNERQAQAAIAVLLALAAGGVDAVSFIVLHHIFTANMTGNTTSLGIAGGHGDARALVPLAAAVATFVAAIAFGTASIELAVRRGLRSAAAPAFIVEMALIGVFMAEGRRILTHNTAPDHGFGFYLLLTVAVTAMGLQTAAFTKALGATVRTTYVSGLLTSAAQELVNLLVPARSGTASYLRDELGLGTRGQSIERLALQLGIWASFVAGAACATYGEGRWATLALTLPLVALLAAAAVDLRRSLQRRSGS